MRVEADSRVDAVIESGLQRRVQLWVYLASGDADLHPRTLNEKPRDERCGQGASPSPGVKDAEGVRFCHLCQRGDEVSGRRGGEELAELGPQA
jgi:hypothetical protein